LRVKSADKRSRWEKPLHLGLTDKARPLVAAALALRCANAGDAR
jgi:hypothetical protein